MPASTIHPLLSGSTHFRGNYTDAVERLRPFAAHHGGECFAFLTNAGRILTDRESPTTTVLPFDAIPRIGILSPPIPTPPSATQIHHHIYVHVSWRHVFPRPPQLNATSVCAILTPIVQSHFGSGGIGSDFSVGAQPHYQTNVGGVKTPPRCEYEIEGCHTLVLVRLGERIS